jgi:hypothetical protein
MAAAWGQRGIGGGGSVAGIAMAALLREVQRQQYGDGSGGAAAQWQRQCGGGGWRHGGSGIAVVAAWPQPWGRVGSSGR